MLKCFIVTALLFVTSALSWAQVATAELSGTILDSSGAAIANAKVTATNVATNRSHETTSDSAGTYIIPLLPPGDYTITAEAPGFRKLVQRGLTLQVNQQAQVDLTMQVGAVAEAVEVTAQAPLLESESSSLGTVVNTQLVNELPLNGRNFVQLAILSPGVNGVGYSASGTIMSGTRPERPAPGNRNLLEWKPGRFQ